MTDPTWREFRFQPHAMRYRWRHRDVGDHGYPLGLEVERWRGEIDEWVPLRNHDVLDFFRMGFRAGRREAGQTELQLSGGDG